jgi:predicted acetyltransferase
MFVLREITTKDKTAYEAYIKSWQNDNESIVPEAIDPTRNNFETLLEKLQEDKSPKDSARVPATMLFYFKDDKIVGVAHIRHELNDALKLLGGHIGYGVAPDERGKGYATDILAESLSFLKSNGVREALITCDDDNEASSAVIFKNHGIESEPHQREDGKTTRRFWIEL